MEYTVVLLLLIGLIASPILLWIHLRRARWRRPRLAMQLVVVGAMVTVFASSGAFWYFYPYGPPGAEVSGWRALGDVCSAAYAGARTAGDSAAVDSVRPVPNVADPNSIYTCGDVRKYGLLGCRPEARCGRLKARLRLPGT